ncbi:MAG: ABC transporter permease subunit [Deltaproteobacteria bacterium]|nr:ABC transporter permease subunit [Deltaproteobacteria bacterium]
MDETASSVARARSTDDRPRLVLSALTFALVVLLGSVLAYVGFRAARFFVSDQTSLSAFFGSQTWNPLADGGLWPTTVGTAMVAVLSLAMALPLSLLVAIYLSELAKPTTRRWLKPTIETLAAIPSVVFGFMVISYFGPALEALVPGAGRSSLTAALAIALMITPTLASLCDDALRSVPREVREAAFALGADHTSVLKRVLLPCARPTIVASTLLVLSRALGETVIVLLVARFVVDGVSWNPLEATPTITSNAVAATQTGTPHALDGAFALMALLAIGVWLLHLLAYRRLRGLRL